MNIFELLFFIMKTVLCSLMGWLVSRSFGFGGWLLGVWSCLFIFDFIITFLFDNAEISYGVEGNSQNRFLRTLKAIRANFKSFFCINLILFIVLCCGYYVREDNSLTSAILSSIASGVTLLIISIIIAKLFSRLNKYKNQ